MSRYWVKPVGYDYGVFDRHGLVAAYPSKGRAEDRAERLERQARQRVRPCLTCGAAFTSDGPHNRMCAACRQHSLHDGAV